MNEYIFTFEKKKKKMTQKLICWNSISRFSYTLWNVLFIYSFAFFFMNSIRELKEKNTDINKINHATFYYIKFMKIQCLSSTSYNLNLEGFFPFFFLKGNQIFQNIS